MQLISRQLWRDPVWLRYVLSGALVSALELLVFAVLIYTWRWSYLEASALVFFFGLVASFWIRKCWVFRFRCCHDHSRQLLFYSLVFVLATAMNLLMMVVLVDWWRVDELLAQGLTMLALGLVTYIVNKTITFRPLPSQKLSITKYIEARREQ